MTLTPADIRRGAEYAAQRYEPRKRTWATPGQLAAALDPQTKTSPALDLIDRELVRLADRAVPADALAIYVPPGEGKSQRVSRRFPEWLLAHNPGLRIAIVSYEQEMAVRWGRQILRDFRHADKRLLDVQVMRDSSAAGRWDTPEGGGVYCVGVGGALTGRPVDCVHGDTEVLTESGYIKIRDIHRATRKPLILSYNHETGCAEWHPVLATRAIPDRRFTEIITTSGRRVICTADHRIWTVGRGYVAAADLRPGERLVTANPGAGQVRAMRDNIHERPVNALESDTGNAAALQQIMPVRGSGHHAYLRAMRQGLPKATLRGRQSPARRVHPDVLLEAVPASRRLRDLDRAADMRDMRQAEAEPSCSLVLAGVPAAGRARSSNLLAVREVLRDAPVRGCQEDPEGADDPTVLSGMHGGMAINTQYDYPLRHLRRTVQQPGPPLLLPRMPGSSPANQTATAMPAMRRAFYSQKRPVGLLRAGLRQRRSFRPDERNREFALQGRNQLRPVVPQDAPADPRTRQSMPSLSPAGPDRAPHQPQAVGEQPGKPDPSLRLMPHRAPQVETDTISVVRRLRGYRDTAYDLQVAGNRNFFAGQVLVHNCLIIDDPVKDREQAESAIYRERAWEWWENVALTRLAPGAITCLIQTRWHTDDLSGRIMSRPSPLRWRVLSLPAIAGDRDPIRRPPGAELPSVRGREPGHFRRLAATMSRYVFAALYQQDPVAAEGNFFRAAAFRYWRPLAGQRHPAEAISAGVMAGAWLDLEGRRTDLADPAVWRFATCDLAASTRTEADWTVIAVWAIDREGDLILLDRARARAEMSDHFALARPLRDKWRYDVLFVPREYWAKTLTADARAAGVPVAEVITDTDKITRAIPAAGRVHAGKTWFPAETSGCQCGNCDGAWLEEWTAELLSFPRGTHDDQTDTLSAAARVAAAHWVPARPPSRPAPQAPELERIAAAHTAATGNGTHHPDLLTMPLG